MSFKRNGRTASVPGIRNTLANRAVRIKMTGLQRWVVS